MQNGMRSVLAVDLRICLQSSTCSFLGCTRSMNSHFAVGSSWNRSHPLSVREDRWLSARTP